MAGEIESSTSDRSNNSSSAAPSGGVHHKLNGNVAQTVSIVGTWPAHNPSVCLPCTPF
jgi:hypothetical protein